MNNDAVGLERIGKITGYKILPADFSTVSPNLPQRIAVLGLINQDKVANFTDLVAEAGTELTTADEVGDRYGYGSQLHQAMRILKPKGSEGVGGIPISFVPIAVNGDQAAFLITPTVVGGTNGSVTHQLVLGGRKGIDGKRYDVAISNGDSNTDIVTKIVNAVNNVESSPFRATSVNSGASAQLECKYAGVDGDVIDVRIETNGEDVGITYAVTLDQGGSGTIGSVVDSLSALSDKWVTIVVNMFDEIAQDDGRNILTDLEAVNGKPDETNPTGNYVGVVMRPFIALTGCTFETTNGNTLGRELQVTNAICPAPKSLGIAGEAAANMAVLLAKQAQNSPHLDVSGLSYPDMPARSSADENFSFTYDVLDNLVKSGESTATYSNGIYTVRDFVTTYNPSDEALPNFRYVRSLMIDFNIKYAYYLKELEVVVDHVIVGDNDFVSVSKFVKPKIWKSTLFSLVEDLVARGLITDQEFTKNGITVDLSSTNPDRFNTCMPYKRTGFLRISSTLVKAGFNFGTV